MPHAFLMSGACSAHNVKDSASFGPTTDGNAKVKPRARNSDQLDNKLGSLWIGQYTAMLARGFVTEGRTFCNRWAISADACSALAAGLLASRWRNSFLTSPLNRTVIARRSSAYKALLSFNVMAAWYAQKISLYFNASDTPVLGPSFSSSSSPIIGISCHAITRIICNLLFVTIAATSTGLLAKTVKPRAPYAGAEEAFIAAKDAAAAADIDKFNSAAPQARQSAADTTSLQAVQRLQVYLEYWRLRIPLLQARNAANNSNVTAPSPEVLASVESETRVFLGKHAGTIYADLLRRDWLYVLARRGDWAAFDAQYPLWALRDEPLLHCWAGFSKVTQDPASAPKVKQEFRDAMFELRDIGDSCSQLIGALVNAGAMSRNDVWRRLQISLDAGGFNAVKRVEPYFSPNASEQAVIAIARSSRQEPTATAKDFTNVNNADRPYAVGLLAANGMRKLHADSNEWAKESFKASSATTFYPDDTLGWMARAGLRSLDWPVVRGAIERMSSETKKDPTWTYWLAKALKADATYSAKPEGKAEIDALFKSIAGQANFYSQLAGEELGQLITIPTKAAAPTEQELAEPARNEGFARALAFYELGLRSEGNREWNFQLRHMTDRQLLAAAEWACRKNILDRCVNTSDRTKTEFDFSQRFVMPFRDELTPIAKEREVELAWIYGLIRQESRFIMDARSSVGASGLMQIMPATGRWIAKKVGVVDFKTEQLKERDTNLRFGTFYLKSVLDDLDGSPAMASAAYNAGPGRPRAWRATLTTPVDTAIFAEIIPFSETRDYVKKVLSNATIYAAIISGKPQSLKSRLGTVSPKAFSATNLP
jgi:soluble lytic murein transglycosylase